MSVSKDLSSKISSDRIKLQDQIIGQFEEDFQIKIFCEKHDNQLVTEMCCNPNCERQESLFCQICIQKDIRHKDECAKFSMPIEVGIQQIAKRFQIVCPENNQEVHRENFDQLAYSEKQNIPEFEKFIQMQKVKVEKDIRAITVTFQQFMDGIKSEIDQKMDEQVKIYKNNYSHFKSQLDATNGSEYKILREYSEYKNLFKRLNNSNDEEAMQFLSEIKKLLKKYVVDDKETEFNMNSIQDLYLLLTDQTTNPPTYQSHNFEVFSLSSIKLQVELLSNKIIETLEQNLQNTPLQKFVYADEILNYQQSNMGMAEQAGAALLTSTIATAGNQSMLATVNTASANIASNLLSSINNNSNNSSNNNSNANTTRYVRNTSSRITLHPNQPEFQYFDDKDNSSDVFIKEKLLNKIGMIRTESSKNIDEGSPQFTDNSFAYKNEWPSSPLKKDRQKTLLNQSFADSIDKQQITFSHEKKNCLIKQDQKNFFLERSQSTRSLQITENVCVTSLTVLAENIVAVGLTNNYIQIYHMETNKVLQDIECKNWIYCLSTLKFQKESYGFKSVAEQILENPERKMSEYGFKLLGGSENSVKIWDTNFIKDQKIYPVMEFRREGFFRGMSLLDLQDQHNLVCGDWDGKIFIWDYVDDNLLFKLDTQGQIVHRLQFIKKQDMFISAHRIDYNQGGILIWKLEYDQDDKDEQGGGIFGQNLLNYQQSQKQGDDLESASNPQLIGNNVNLNLGGQDNKNPGYNQNQDLTGTKSLPQERNRLIRCTLLKRLEDANSVNCFVSLKTNPDYIVTSERNHIKLWDIKEKKLIKTLYKGESKAKDILLIENSSSGSNYFVTLFANNSVMKMIDSNEFLVGQYQLEDYPCDQCRKYFHSSKMSFLEAQDGQLYVIVVRHKHICSHFSEYMTQQQFHQIEKQSSMQIQQTIKSQNDDNKDFQKCTLFTRLSIQGLKLQIAKHAQKHF